MDGAVGDVAVGRSAPARAWWQPIPFLFVVYIVAYLDRMYEDLVWSSDTAHHRHPGG